MSDQVLEEHLKDQLELGDDFFWHRVRWSVVASRLPVDRDFELVDCGAGTGITGRYLQQHRPLARYRYVEPIESLQEVLASQFGEDRSVGLDEPVPNADFVTLLDVLEHQEDDLAFLKGLAARMRPGAELILTVPAMAGLWSGWDVALGHYRRYGKSDLRAVLEKAGFEVERVDFLFPEMVPAAAIRRRRLPAGKPIPSDEAEFPELSRSLNGVLTAVGLTTSAARRFNPFGTSLVAISSRRPG